MDLGPHMENKQDPQLNQISQLWNALTSQKSALYARINDIQPYVLDRLLEQNSDNKKSWSDYFQEIQEDCEKLEKALEKVIQSNAQGNASYLKQPYRDQAVISQVQESIQLLQKFCDELSGNSPEKNRLAHMPSEQPIAVKFGNDFLQHMFALILLALYFMQFMLISQAAALATTVFLADALLLVILCSYLFALEHPPTISDYYNKLVDKLAYLSKVNVNTPVWEAIHERSDNSTLTTQFSSIDPPQSLRSRHPSPTSTADSLDSTQLKEEIQAGMGKQDAGFLALRNIFREYELSLTEGGVLTQTIPLYKGDGNSSIIEGYPDPGPFGLHYAINMPDEGDGGSNPEETRSRQSHTTDVSNKNRLFHVVNTAEKISTATPSLESLCSEISSARCSRQSDQSTVDSGGNESSFVFVEKSKENGESVTHNFYPRFS